jgi:hypothetical protein
LSVLHVVVDLDHHSSSFAEWLRLSTIANLTSFFKQHSPPDIVPTAKMVVAFKPLLLALLAGTGSAFAVTQPQASAVPNLSKTTALKMNGGAATSVDPPPELKVCVAD